MTVGYPIHFSKHWNGPSMLEETCACPKAACGMVDGSYVDPDCDQHGMWAEEWLMRSGHDALDCPALLGQQRG